ncbi:MAG TPA: DmsC/YnfH family molybdoenzyme membrane anchor subunit [Acidimicrobiales bacterium]|nr:DmsC/YnfH family molybdoenzyme membrane anchor subunit [Acidimicrobiales bacterium]
MEVAVPLTSKPRTARRAPSTGGPRPGPEPVIDLGAGFGARGPDLLPLDAGEHYRFGFDMGACIGCHSCEVACAEQNGLPDGTAWRRVGEIEGGDHPHTRRFHVSMSCNHCLEPACLEGCPTNAYEKLANGIVAHHAEDCIGCQYCTWTCPYSVPAFQPDRRIVTKCDMCQPRLAEGYAPACVAACPTHAITVEKIDVAAWRADHAAADAPLLPSGEITLSTTRIMVPAGVPADAFAAGDWDVRPEDPHWPLVWLTVLSQVAVGMSATAGTAGSRALAAVLAVAAMAGAVLHLGRPVVAWKALRNVRRSWLSREVALLSLYGLLAAGAAAVPTLAGPAAVVGAAGLYASGRLYVVPGRPAWDTPLTIVRFAATAAAVGPVLTGHSGVAAAAAGVGVAATALNWWRLSSRPGRALRPLRPRLPNRPRFPGRRNRPRFPGRSVRPDRPGQVRRAAGSRGVGPADGTGRPVSLRAHPSRRSRRADRADRARRAGPASVRLELGRFGPWSAARVALTAAGAAAALAGAPALVAFGLLGTAELIGRWLFYVTVVPLDMPRSFWRHPAGAPR